MGPPPIPEAPRSRWISRASRSTPLDRVRDERDKRPVLELEHRTRGPVDDLRVARGRHAQPTRSAASHSPSPSSSSTRSSSPLSEPGSSTSASLISGPVVRARPALDPVRAAREHQLRPLRQLVLRPVHVEAPSRPCGLPTRPAVTRVNRRRRRVPAARRGRRRPSPRSGALRPCARRGRSPCRCRRRRRAAPGPACRHPPRTTPAHLVRTVDERPGEIPGSPPPTRMRLRRPPAAASPSAGSSARSSSGASAGASAASSAGASARGRLATRRRCRCGAAGYALRVRLHELLHRVRGLRPRDPSAGSAPCRS